uniref:Hyccin-like isoform X1 n=1 Tax=Hirondellea gigas TaxID=1518452 RepID=A0A6A7FXR6_9CRUS
MESWSSVVESWLLECSDATQARSPDCETQSTAAPAVPEQSDAITDQQTEQLLAVCNLQREKLITAIFTLFEERNKYVNLLERVLRELFALSRSRVSQLRCFALQFAPSLIYVDLLSLALGDTKNLSSVELVLLALYNCEVLDAAGQFRLPHYRLPTLARQSCYHDPASLGPASFSTDSLVRLETSPTLPPMPVVPHFFANLTAAAAAAHTAITDGSGNHLTTNGTLSSNGSSGSSSQHIATVTASTRPAVLSSVLTAYNAVITTLHATALEYLCKFISRLITHGLPRASHYQQQQRSSYSGDGTNSSGGVAGSGASTGSGVGGVPVIPTPRVNLAPDLLLQFALAAYAAVHNLGGGNSKDSTSSGGSKGKGGSSSNNITLPRHNRHHKRARCSSSSGPCVCVAVQAIEDITMRSECDLLPDLLHLCYAINHNLRHNNIMNGGEGSDSPPLVSAPLPPSTPLTKTCITNASFRTKKLPEDIPVMVTENIKVSTDGKVLVSICEGNEEVNDGVGGTSGAGGGVTTQEGGATESGGGTTTSSGGGGPGAKLAGILRREGRDSKEGRDSSRSLGGKDSSEGSKEKSSSKFTPTKFSTGNIAIPGLKRKEKDKMKNGDKKDKDSSGDKKSDKSDKKDKQRDKSSSNSNKYSGGLGSEAVDGGVAGGTSPTKGTRGGSNKLYKEQEQIQQLIEMKIISRPTSSTSSLQDQQASGNIQEQQQQQQHRADSSSSLSDSLSSASIGHDHHHPQHNYSAIPTSDSTDTYRSYAPPTESGATSAAYTSVNAAMDTKLLSCTVGSSAEALMEYSKLGSVDTSDGGGSGGAGSLGSIV